ncbi:hypothetical protein [Cellulomonas sp. SG140]|uniref:hypothetical protein n=1 Tax=Cellulomonas sp. SG140 TaxID=2976536 RepID=UPI0021E84071|nr:hypothetical protein [Cellulomonas sp. SG140]
MATTSRRLPARVYWVRRAVVLGVPLVLLLLVLVVIHPWAGKAADRAAARAPVTTSATTSAAAPAAPASPSPTPTPTPSLRGGVGDCQPAQLALGLTPTAVDVPAGVSPTFTVTIKNTGTAPCLVDAGDAYREVVITSGADRVWSSKDCVAANAPRRTLLLAAGQSDTTQVPWNRVRSAAGCPGGLSRPGTGTYQATLNLAGATGGPAVFVLH